MLTLLGQPAKYCDGISRRSFLKIGGFAFGSAASLSLPDILRAESLAGRTSNQKAGARFKDRAAQARIMGAVIIG